ncbi:MAG: protein-glutamate O-methyltransferase [Kofleriaceae bacterium]|nr:protein-glutamate O-methyltransferase [Kofleriaceae bacterium]
MNRKPELARAEFERIAVMIKSQTGMDYKPGKETLVRQRLANRLQALQKTSYGEYLDFVESESSKKEMTRFIDLLTTNKTSFFRENAHFEFLTEHWIPQVESESPRKLRLWSSACSSGQEPYSIAMHLSDKLSSKMLHRTRILATDLSTDILAKAQRGVYSADVAEELSEVQRSQYLEKSRGSSGNYRVKNTLRSHIHFAQLNLMERWPMRGPFDVIFCRNVMIYFDKPTQERLVNRFYDLLDEGGYLFIGHAESLSGTKHKYNYIKPAVWQK